jgi:hypothetical protein
VTAVYLHLIDLDMLVSNTHRIYCGTCTHLLNRQTLTLSILTKSQTFHFDLIDDRKLNENVWPVFVIHQYTGVLPLFAKIGENNQFSYDPSFLHLVFIKDMELFIFHDSKTKLKYFLSHRYIFIFAKYNSETGIITKCTTILPDSILGAIIYQ